MFNFKGELHKILQGEDFRPIPFFLFLVLLLMNVDFPFNRLQVVHTLAGVPPL